MAFEQSGAEAYRLFMTVVRATAEVNTEVRLCAYILRKHVQRGTKGTSSVG